MAHGLYLYITIRAVFHGLLISVELILSHEYFLLDEKECFHRQNVVFGQKFANAWRGLTRVTLEINLQFLGLYQLNAMFTLNYLCVSHRILAVYPKRKKGFK